MNKTCAIVVLAFAALLSTRAFAQRGSHMPELPREPAPENTLSGFPGFFDTNVAPHERLVTEVPTFAADYGLTRDVTVGVNGLSALTILADNPVYYLKARYRFLSGGVASSAVTGYGMYARIPGDPKDKISTKGYDFYTGFLTSNTTYYFSNELHGTVSVIGGGLHQGRGKPGQLEYNKAQGALFLTALGVTYFPTHVSAIQLVAIANVYNALSADNAVGTTTANIKLGKYPVVGRAAVEVLVNKQWLLSGYYWVTSEGGMPWAGISYLW